MFPVLWQVTPRFAKWMTDPSNILTTSGLLNTDSVVVELGCGVSGVLGLSLSIKVKNYIATDQPYILKMLRANLLANRQPVSRPGHPKYRHLKVEGGNIIVKAIDWETSDLSSFYSELHPPLEVNKVDFVLACDCIYNEALVDPFVDTCAELCRMGAPSSPTLCVVAQQLRSPDVFEAWLNAFHAKFRVWRLSDQHVSKDLGEDSGFVVHVGIARTSSNQR
jgi:hypothetical protein